MADEEKELTRERSASGDVDVMKVNREQMRRLNVNDDDLLRQVASPHQIRVEAQLDAEGIRLKVVGNAHFGDANDLGRDDGMVGRSMAAYTIEADDDDKRRVADLLTEIGAKYRTRVIGGAMKSALLTYDPMTDSVVEPATPPQD